MKKYEYREYVRNGEEKKSLPEEIKVLRDKVVAIGRTISATGKDKGWKGGIKSTSYDYSSDRIKWGGWSADCESMWSLQVDGQPVARVYDCHGQGFFEMLNEKTINKLYDQVVGQ